ncbi:MAG: radical SAM protein [Syntrophotaleaceae bacterium]
MNEWSPSKKWNPFNSYKLLAQVYRWRHIVRGGAIPQPALVTIDPINKCNLKCAWCNTEYLLQKNHRMLSRDTLMDIADFLPSWQGSPKWPAGVEAICIAGGGEPLLHPDIGPFIDQVVANGIEVGVITNGSNMAKLIEPLSKCTWVGVSVDAGTAATFQRLKQVDYFQRILDNIRQLTSYAATHDCRLGRAGAGAGVSYKYLLTPDNIDDIVPAARLAKELGCTSFHLRPASTSWDKLSVHKHALFLNDENMRLKTAPEEVRPLEDKNFGVYGITHKFDSNLNPTNGFDRCHAIFMTCVVMPPRDESSERFRLGLCCDRRGDLKLEATGAGNSMEEIAHFWGSDAHWEILDSIDLNDCPRCTYQPHNQIMEHVIRDDSMTYKFI